MSRMKEFAEKVSGFMGHDGEITEDVENVVKLCVEAMDGRRSDHRADVEQYVTKAAHSMEFCCRDLRSSLSHCDSIEGIVLTELHRKASNLRREVEFLALAVTETH